MTEAESGPRTGKGEPEQTLQERGDALLAELRDRRLSRSAKHEELVHAGFTDDQAADLLDGLPLEEPLHDSCHGVDRVANHDAARQRAMTYAGIMTAGALGVAVLLSYEQGPAASVGRALGWALGSLVIAAIIGIVVRIFSRRPNVFIWTYTILLLVTVFGQFARHQREAADRRQSHELAGSAASIVERYVDDDDTTDSEFIEELTSTWEKLNAGRTGESADYVRVTTGLMREIQPVAHTQDQLINEFDKLGGLEPDTMESAEDIEQRLDLMTRLGEAVDRLHRFHSNLGDEADRRLAATGMSATARAQYLEETRRSIPRRVAGLDVMIRFIRLASDSLSILKQHFGAWQADEEEGIVFDDEDVQTKYMAVMGELADVCETLEQYWQDEQAHLRAQAKKLRRAAREQ